MQIPPRLLFLFVGLLMAPPLFAGPKTFTFRLQGEPETLDWNRAHTPVETHLLVNLMDGLVGLDDQLKPIPALAESWKLSKDRKTYTFKIRKGVSWSDGVPLRAEDFVTSWKRLLTPATAASYAYLLFDVEGAKDFNAGKCDFGKVAIRSIDDQHFQVKLSQPITHWIMIPSFWVTFPMREDLIKLHGPRWTDPGKLVTLGAYTLGSHEVDSKFVLNANPKFYQGRPKIDEVRALIVSDDKTALNLYESGKIDFLTDLPILDAKRYRTHSHFKVFPYLKTVYLGFNTSKAPMDDVHLRRALGMAIDRSKIPELLQGGQTAAYSFVPPNMAAHSNSLSLEFDPAKAREELKLSRFAKAPGNPALQFLVLNWDRSLTVAQYIQAQVLQNLGLQITLNPFDNKTYRAQLDLKINPIFLTSWSADFPDPDNFLSIFMSGAGNNRPGWSNPKFDQLVLQARAMPESPRRQKVYADLQRELQIQSAAVLPIYYEPIVGLLNPKISGMTLNPLNYLNLSRVERH